MRTVGRDIRGRVVQLTNLKWEAKQQRLHGPRILICEDEMGGLSSRWFLLSCGFSFGSIESGRKFGRFIDFAETRA